MLTNEDLQRMVSTSDEWIVTRTGVRERRILGDDEGVSTMAVEAGKAALEVAELSPNLLDMVIVATNSSDRIVASSACYVQSALGAKHAAAFDAIGGCSGFIYALVTAYQFIITGAYENVLVVGSEAISRIVDWEDRSICVLFGDGAGAVVVQASEHATDLLSFALGSDGSGADLLYLPSPCGKPADRPQDGRYYLRMNGREIFKAAVTSMAEASKRVIDAAGLQLSDIDLFIPHQANTRIIQAASKSLGIPSEKVFINVDRYGNLSAASTPVALCEAVEQGRIRERDHVVLAAFGAGLTWAAMVLHWQAGG